MSKEIDLITALAKAMGFKVVVERDFKERDEPFDEDMEARQRRMAALGRTLMTVGCRYIRRDNNDYVSMLVVPEVSYKVIPDLLEE